MNRTIMSAAVACALTAATTSTANADTALFLGGTGDPLTPTQAQMAWLHHQWVGADDTTVGIGYPASPVAIGWSVGVGVTNVDQAVDTTGGSKTVIGVSQGALVIDEMKSRIMAEPGDKRPAAADLKFVTLGDPDNPRGLLGHIPFIPSIPAPVETPYDTTVVIRQYDGFADWPDRPLNLLATANALMGIVFVHPNYDVDLGTVPQTDITEQTNSMGGKTTTYLVPTRNLPLTEVLRRLGVDQRLVDRLDTFLRPLIDSAYDQPLPKVPESPTVAARAGIDEGVATRNVSVSQGITNDVTPHDKPKPRTREPVKTDVKTDTAGIHSGAATKDHPFPKGDTTTVAAHDEPKPKKYDSPHKAAPVAGTDASAAKPRKHTSEPGDKRPSGAKPARASHPRPKKS